MPLDSNPQPSAVRAGPEEVVVRVNGRAQRLKYHPGETLLETMRRGGVPAPFMCEQGVCGTCMVRRLQGMVAMRENHILSDRDIAEGYTLACQGVPCEAVCEIEIKG